MVHGAEATEVNLAELTLDAAIEDLSNASTGLDAGPIPLSGMAITKYVLHDLSEPRFQKMAEPYLFGIAVDSTLKPVKIPWGLDAVDPTKFKIPKVGVEATVTFGNEDGAPLVLPPVHDFLAVVLMVADSDSAKATAEVLKAVSSLATNAEVLKVVGGAAPAAGAVLAVVGGILNVAIKGIEGNRDDIISVYSAYFGPSKLVPGTEHHLSQPGSEVWLKVLED